MGTPILRRGSNGSAVADVQRRLVALGYTVDDPSGVFELGTESALRSFQRQRGLEPDGICGPETWSALVEAGWQLGDRLLYLRSPMLRGDDAADLQRRLATLGFDPGRVDGIFGPDTEKALREFQLNSGVTVDGVCGPETIRELRRLERRSAGTESVTVVRERERLLSSDRTLENRRVSIAVPQGSDALASAAARRLEQDHGAEVLTIVSSDPSHQCALANDFGSELHLTIEPQVEPRCCCFYFESAGVPSPGGRRFATNLAGRLETVRSLSRPILVEGRTHRVLRETRMPAVLCRLGPSHVLVECNAEIAAAIGSAMASWSEQPVESD